MTDSYWCAKCGVPHTLGQRCPASLRAKWRRQQAQRAPHHGWYSSPVWRALRAQALAASPWCAACLALGRYTPATEVDHITPHRGDWTLFTDRDNLQPLCRPCHSRKTMAEMRGDTHRKAAARAPETARRLADARRPVAPAAPDAPHDSLACARSSDAPHDSLACARSSDAPHGSLTPARSPEAPHDSLACARSPEAPHDSLACARSSEAC